MHEPILNAVKAPADEALIARIAQSDRLAMQVLFARHHVQVYRYVLRLLRDEMAAQDVIGYVFLDVWRQANRFEGRSAVSTWLIAIARFKALSLLRKRRDESCRLLRNRRIFGFQALRRRRIGSRWLLRNR